jgi:rubrerythrin
VSVREAIMSDTDAPTDDTRDGTGSAGTPPLMWQCPECDYMLTDAVDPARVELLGDSIEVRWTCTECGCVWEDHYGYTARVIVESDTGADT